MMKAINLQSLMAAKQSLSPEQLHRFAKSFGIEMKMHEFDDVQWLVQAIYEQSTIVPLHNFFVGFRIEQISKEFDLLRVCEESVVNIELKRQRTGDRMERQLRQNRYYLNSLNRRVYLFTFVSSERALYTLEGETFRRATIDELVAVLHRQRQTLSSQLNEWFTPTKYLVSPFNQIEPFLQSHYFLTSQQQEFKTKIVDTLRERSTHHVMAIEGEAGTGKTLLTYDIAKRYHTSGWHVEIVHCGLLNKGHLQLQRAGFHIRSHYTLDGAFPQADLMIVDEAQRMPPQLMSRLLRESEAKRTPILFSYDPTQYIGREEAQYKNEETIAQAVTMERPLRLTGRIRSNKEIISFIRSFFNRRRPLPPRPYDNIQFQYFTALHDAKQFVRMKETNGWKFIDYIVPRANGERIQDMSLNFERNSHHVIGQEFDKVVVIVGEAVTYDGEGRLIDTDAHDYLAARMIHQNMTRAREQLCVVVLNNVEVLDTCIAILGERPMS